MDEQEERVKFFLRMTTEIVSSFVRNNEMAGDKLPDFIHRIYGTYEGIAKKQNNVSKEHKPAVPIDKSITDDYVICLEDGKKFKMMKRHLRTIYNLTPDEYRRKWSLPHDYPMVAPSYARKRSAVAQKNGLGVRHVS